MHAGTKVAHALCWTPVRGRAMSHESQPKRARREALAVRGVVQGVGFRPFVYRLALEEGLAGFIGNDTDGVTIEIEGPSASLDSFLARLRSDAPPLARIDSVAVREIAPSGDTGFRIVASEVLGRVSTGIPADAATCPDCLRELLSPTDRRFRYPFLNCTNCGPRYHHHPPHPLRPPANLDGTIQNVPRLPGRVQRPRKPPLPRPAQRLLGLRPTALPSHRRRPPTIGRICNTAGCPIHSAFFSGMGGKAKRPLQRRPHRQKSLRFERARLQSCRYGSEFDVGFSP